MVLNVALFTNKTMAIWVTFQFGSSDPGSLTHHLSAAAGRVVNIKVSRQAHLVINIIDIYSIQASRPL